VNRPELFISDRIADDSADSAAGRAEEITAAPTIRCDVHVPPAHHNSVETSGAELSTTFVASQNWGCTAYKIERLRRDAGERHFDDCRALSSQ
jgi:hypothetical protein